MVGLPACLRVGISLDVVKVFLSLSHWCSLTVALWIIIKYFSNLICINYIKFLQILSETEKKFYTYWSIQSYTFFQFKCGFNKKIEIIFNL